MPYKRDLSQVVTLLKPNKNFLLLIKGSASFAHVDTGGAVIIAQPGVKSARHVQNSIILVQVQFARDNNLWIVLSRMK